MKILLLLFAAWSINASAVNPNTFIPPNALKPDGVPLLKSTLAQEWPTVPQTYRVAMPAKIEKETCVSLTGSLCFTSKAGLNTKRELGISYGQFTIAYDKDGTERFNAFEEARKLDPRLRAWTMGNRYDPKLGMLALVLRSKKEWSLISGAATELDHTAFALVMHNAGSVIIDRRLCAAVPGCNPNVWFGNVELYSNKSKVPDTKNGYTKSWHQISREYPRDILNRRFKYESLMR